MRLKNNIAGLAVILFAVGISLGGCTKREPPAEPVAEQPKTEPPAPPAVPPTETKPVPGASTKPAEPAHNYVKELLAPAKLKEKAPETYKGKFDTTRGEFTITVTRAWAPLEADRFYNLVKHHFYDNAPFFPVSPPSLLHFATPATPALNS